MTLTEEALKKVVDHLNLKSQGGITCPICGQRMWVVNKTIMESREFNDGNFVIGGDSSIMPFVTLTCSNCAHTLFFNAIMLGVVEKK